MTPNTGQIDRILMLGSDKFLRFFRHGRQTVSKLKLLVAPADTANNSERWYEFVVYLSRTLEQTIGLDTAFDMADFRSRMHQADIVFAPPTEAVLLTHKAAYIPICRPADQSEEIVFASHADGRAVSLKGIHGAEVITCGNNVTTRLGLTLLAKKGMKPGSITSKNSWMHVLKALQSTPEAFAFFSKNFYEELNPLSRENLTFLGSSKLNRVYAQMLVKPSHRALADHLSMVLMSMKESEKGSQVLDKLGISGWNESTNDDVLAMGQLLRIG